MNSIWNDLGWWGYFHPEAWVVINVLLFGIAAPLTLAYFATWWAARPRKD